MRKTNRIAVVTLWLLTTAMVMGLAAQSFLGRLETDTVLGRDTAGQGPVEQLSLTSPLGFSGSGAVQVTTTGADAAVVSGTAGTSGDLAQWNVDGDLVDGPTPPTGVIVGTTDTQTLSSKTLDLPQVNDTSDDHQYVFAVSELAADRTVTLPLLTGADTFTFNDFAAALTNKTIDANSNTLSNLAHGAEVDNPSSGVHGVTGSVVGTSDTQTLSNKTLTAPQINDTTADHQYIVGVSELAADRTVTLPLLAGNDTFVFNDFTATLTTKTIDADSNTITNIGSSEIVADIISGLAAVGTFESGDTFACLEAGVGLRECDFDDLPSGGGGGGLIDVDVFTSSDTWNRDTGTTQVIVFVTGAGGGGGTGDSGDGGGSGGGGGGTAVGFLDVSAISSSTITIGGGGSAASAGGNSSWADGTNTLTGNGGSAGESGSVSGPGGNVSGGGSSGGLLNTTGGGGSGGGGTGSSNGHGGHGGGSFWTGGGGGGEEGAAEAGIAGNSGSGGGGGSVSASGGGGGGGVVFVLEFSWLLIVVAWRPRRREEVWS